MNRFLIISLGSIGRKRLSILRALRPLAKIYALRLKSTENEVPPDADGIFYDINDALDKNWDAAFICSPASTHSEVAVECLRAKIPTFIEKPLAHTFASAKKIVKASKIENVPVAVGFCLRYLSVIQKAKHLLHEGAIGRVFYVRAEVGQHLPEWRDNIPYQKTVSAQKELGGGVLHELCHEIDLVNYIFGVPDVVMSVTGNYKFSDIDVDDMAELILKYNNKPLLASIHLDFLQRYKSREIKFVGEKGTLTVDIVANKMRLFDSKSKTWSDLEEHFPVDERNMLSAEIKDFLGHLNGEPSAFARLEDGCNVSAVVEAAQVSSMLNKAQNMEICFGK